MNLNETYLVAYKFGDQSVRGSSLRASKGIRIHLDHATANSGRVLFTVGRFPAPSEQDKIRPVICTRCTGFFCLAIIKGPPNDIYCIIEEPSKHYFTEKVSYSL